MAKRRWWRVGVVVGGISACGDPAPMDTGSEASTETGVATSTTAADTTSTAEPTSEATTSEGDSSGEPASDSSSDSSGGDGCTDGVMDGLETDVDCGGPSCPVCIDGEACVMDADCLAMSCVAGVCGVPGPACADQVVNGAETDVDCGGPDCPGCADELACVAFTDCASMVCGGGVCQAPKCFDGVQNGDESDVDCGGLLCTGCADGEVCDDQADCASGSCAVDVCVEATCVDGVKSGAETDADCGGPECELCAEGKACVIDDDCVTALCLGAVCSLPSCMDGLQNGMETKVDCGGPDCEACPIAYFTSFEGACPDGWTLTGDWQCGTPMNVGPATAYAGTQCIATRISSTYSDLQSWAGTNATSPAIDLVAGTNPTLTFRMWIDTEGSTYDGANLKISSDDGMNYEVVSTVTPGYMLTVDGQPAWGGHAAALGWQLVQADLSAFAGQVVRLRFGFRSDSSGAFPGVYIDDLLVE